MKNLYEILGVKKGARKTALKKAYYDLAKQHHPDKNNGVHSEEFSDIVLAYKILSDPVKRKKYDKTGEIDEVNVSSIVINAIAEMYHSLISDQNFDFRIMDIFERMKEFTESKRVKMESAVLERRNTIKKLKEVSRRISGKDDFFKELTESNIPSIEFEISKFEKDIEVANSILKFLKDYKYKTDDQVVGQVIRRAFVSTNISA